MDLTTKRLPSTNWLNSARWLVIDRHLGGATVGMIERFGPAKNEEHPWKMYIGIGETIRYLGATYQGMATALDLLGQNLERIAEDDEGTVTKVRTTVKTQCDDCEPEGCTECWFNLKGSLTVINGGPTEEGYSQSAELYEFDGDVLTRMTDTSGRDCDGRVDYHYEDVATDLTGMVPHYRSDEPNPGVKVPKWEKVTATQRDYTAEAAGY